MSNWNQHSDVDVISACAAGDRSALEELSRRYYRQAYSMALLNVRQPDIALDIAQEAFIRIFRNIKRFDSNRSFSAWMYVIVRNLSHNYRERKKNRMTAFSDVVDETVLEQVSRNTEVSLERRERKRLLWQAINDLNEKEREIIVLKDIEGFSYKELSDCLSIPEGTVMSRLYNARKKLAAMLKPEELR